MDNVVFVILGPALIAAGIVAYRGSAWVYVRAVGAAAVVAGAIMALIGFVNAFSGTG
jgi:hypothetical protein